MDKSYLKENILLALWYFTLFVIFFGLAFLAAWALASSDNAPYKMEMNIYNHTLCYKYEYEIIEHTPNGEILKYRGEKYAVTGVWFVGSWPGVWPDYKDYAWVWEEYSDHNIIDIGMCIYYSFTTKWSGVDSTFISLYDHPEAINMLNGVDITYKIFE